MLTDELSDSNTSEMVSVATQTDHRTHAKSTTFYVGDSSSEESDSDDVDVMGVATTETQTEESMIVECQLQSESRPPRPLNECVAILKSSVGLRCMNHLYHK